MLGATHRGDVSAQHKTCLLDAFLSICHLVGVRCALAPEIGGSLAVEPDRSERATASARWYCEGLLWRRAVLTGRRGSSSLACERLVGVDTKGAAASTLIRLTDRALPPRVDARVAASELWPFNRSQCPSHSLGRWMCEWPYVNWREALGGSRAQDGGSGCHECLIPSRRRRLIPHQTRTQFPHNSRNSLKRMPSRRFGSGSSMVWVRSPAEDRRWFGSRSSVGDRCLVVNPSQFEAPRPPQGGLLY